MQACTGCKVGKSRDNFYAAPNKRGTMAKCKDCKK